ncbi:TMV resistance protein N-like [Eucalyptus grandis]|uniref:TMV resistance protein N-like n=1 Tax=Eucalyptus grandis TaxID=71139 RepID=UPI00192EC1D8|nr:TMV resistance protein N-like [Eucalyptus grandis]
MARNTSSSTTGPQWNHDVFVGIGHFGEENIEGAEKIEDNCPNALHEPTFAFALVVLSKNYVDSYPCRLQLVKILDCKRVHNLEVIPIFYMEREKVLNLARCDELEPGHRKALEEAEEMPGCDLKAANGYVPVILT